MLLDPEDYTGKEEFLASEMTNAMNTNAIGVLCAINAFLPLIRKSSVKKVIAISSGAADIGVTMTASLSGHIPYSVSKAALNLIIAKYACAHRTEGIVFLALHPGYVYTATEDLKSSRCSHVSPKESLT